MQTIPFHSLYVDCKNHENTEYLEYKKMIEDHLAYSAGQVQKTTDDFFAYGVTPYSPKDNKYLSFCIENKELHLAVYDAQNKEFSRNIEFSELKKVKSKILQKLDMRIQNTVAGTLKFKDQNIEQHWKKELDAIHKEEKENEKYKITSFNDRLKNAINRANRNKFEHQEQREKILSSQANVFER